MALLALIATSTGLTGVEAADIDVGGLVADLVLLIVQFCRRGELDPLRERAESTVLDALHTHAFGPIRDSHRAQVARCHP